MFNLAFIFIEYKNSFGLFTLGAGESKWLLIKGLCSAVFSSAGCFFIAIFYRHSGRSSMHSVECYGAFRGFLLFFQWSTACPPALIEAIENGLQLQLGCRC